MPKEVWPSWRYGPGKAKGVFACAADVPAGWVADRAHVFDDAAPEPVEAPPAPVKRGPGRPRKA